jgi:hypothetical protein
LHPLQKCSVADLHVRIVRCVGHERAHAPHGLALLRARRERPCCRCGADAAVRRRTLTRQDRQPPRTRSGSCGFPVEPRQSLVWC